MRFFFSGEIDALVSDAWRNASRPLEKRLNAALGKRDYGLAVREFALIPMIMRPEWQKDFYKEGRLLVENLLSAVRDVQRKAGKGLNGDALIADILATVS